MNAAQEWNKVCECAGNRNALIKVFKTLKDEQNRNALRRHLGFVTAQERREITANWKAINSTTQAECNAHCQFAGLF